MMYSVYSSATTYCVYNLTIDEVNYTQVYFVLLDTMSQQLPTSSIIQYDDRREL